MDEGQETTMAKTKAPRQKRQQQIPGTEPATIPVLDAAAEDFFEARDAWQKLHAPMIEAQQKLIDEIHTQIKKGNLPVPPKSETEVVTIYTFSDSEGIARRILWGRQEKVKVAKVKSNGAGAMDVELDA